MTVYEMEGFLRGKCLPGDMKVNESNAQYLVRKFSELQSQNADMAVQLANAESKRRELAAENAALKAFSVKLGDMHNDLNGEGTGIQGRAEVACQQAALEAAMEEFDAIKTPETDAYLAEVRASSIPDEATERDLFEEWVMEKIFISKTTLEGLRTDDGYRNSTLSGTDYNGMWSQWKAIRAAQLRQEAAQ
ncbi:hypothetical protein [Citrobacter braakii]|uniref:hypothetical protein n=1 Tax=Citrobacter braakii TaxID=57706 RepID=UPI0029641EC1|nr:hypothetical protein [Citrobacter braakii]MDW2592630.1 hypothetical protein [Citrobacter braakii]MDW2656507.1 hypothetical protein [Citrobacter braakii]MDW2704222.1 hypothetical protein [Citrobacter braakii]